MARRADRLAVEGARQQVEAAGGRRAAILEGRVEGRERRGIIAAADAELEPAAAQHVERRRILGEADRQFQRDGDDRRAEADARRPRGHGSQEDEGRGTGTGPLAPRREMVLRDPSDIEAQLLRRDEQIDELAEQLRRLGIRFEVGQEAEAKPVCHERRSPKTLPPSATST